MNPFIVAYLKATPGIHAVSTQEVWGLGRYFLVEVEENGTIHKLSSPDGKRDGVLRDDGWEMEALPLPFVPINRAAWAQPKGPDTPVLVKPINRTEVMERLATLLRKHP